MKNTNLFKSMLMIILILSIPFVQAETYENACNDRADSVRDRIKALDGIIDVLSIVASAIYAIYTLVSAVALAVNTIVGVLVNCGLAKALIATGILAPAGESLELSSGSILASVNSAYAPVREWGCVLMQGWCGFCSEEPEEESSTTSTTSTTTTTVAGTPTTPSTTTTTEEATVLQDIISLPGQAANYVLNIVGIEDYKSLLKDAEESADSAIAHMAPNLNPMSSIYISSACLALVPTILKLREFTAIQDTYACCIESACAYGRSIRICEQGYVEATCTYFTGGLITAVANLLIGLVSQYGARLLSEQIAEYVPWLGCPIALLQVSTIPGEVEAVTGSFNLLFDTLDNADCREFDFLENTIEPGQLRYIDEIYSITQTYDLNYRKNLQQAGESGTQLLESTQNLYTLLTNQEIPTILLPRIYGVGFVEKLAQLQEEAYNAQVAEIEKKYTEQGTYTIFNTMLTELINVDGIVTDICRVRHND